jgi:type VI secretion system secreted protein VgrG
MPRQSNLRYIFEPAGGETFEVVEFNFTEGLSQPFVLDVELSSGNPAVDFGQILDQPALFTIWRGETTVCRKFCIAW